MTLTVASTATDPGLARTLSAFESPEADPVDALTRLFDMIRPRRGENAQAAAARYDAFLVRLEANPNGRRRSGSMCSVCSARAAW